MIVTIVHEFNLVIILLRSADIPMDPYWGAAMLACTRAILTLIASAVVAKVKRKPIYLACVGCVSVGTFSLAAYCYFNQNAHLTSTFPIASWIPIFSILICYVGYAFGMGSIPFMLQVGKYNLCYAKVSMNFASLGRTIASSCQIHGKCLTWHY